MHQWMDLIQIFAMAVFIKSFGNNGIKTDRERVRLCLKTIDPESVKRRKAHELKRQMYVFQGPNFKWNIYSYDKLKPFGFPIHEAVDRFSRKIFRVLARPYLMTLHVIFLIHVNFPITSRSILKTTVHENRNSEFFYVTWENFFSKRRFYGIVHARCIWLIFPFYHNLFLFFKFLYLSFFNYFSPYHVTFYRHGSFLVFLRNFLFNSFPLIF